MDTGSQDAPPQHGIPIGLMPGHRTIPPADGTPPTKPKHTRTSAPQAQFCEKRTGERTEHSHQSTLTANNSNLGSAERCLNISFHQYYRVPYMIISA